MDSRNKSGGTTNKGSSSLFDRILLEYDRFCEKLTGVPSSEYRQAAKREEKKWENPAGRVKGQSEKTLTGRGPEGTGWIKLLQELLSRWR